MLGAVGTGAGLGPKALLIQSAVMGSLGIGVEDGATQVIGRDRYAELICTLAIVATGCEHLATEIRNLQRSEVGEVAEAFDAEKQVGSSTMAQKRNPVTAENICSLSRIVRGFVSPAFDNMILWHERDLANSAGERIMIPHVFILTDDVVIKTAGLMRNLEVYPDAMAANMRRAGDAVMAESVLLCLARKGMNRQDAHELVRKLSMKSIDERGSSFRELLKRNETVLQHMTAKDIDAALDPQNYLGVNDPIIDALELIKEKPTAAPTKKRK
jgi:adenylosuccinate lyase